MFCYFKHPTSSKILFGSNVLICMNDHLEKRNIIITSANKDIIILEITKGAIHRYLKTHLMNEYQS